MTPNGTRRRPGRPRKVRPADPPADVSASSASAASEPAPVAVETPASAPADVLELLPAPLEETPANVEAAEASLAPETEPPAPGAPGATAPSSAPASSPGSASSRPPVTGPIAGVPSAGRWSDRKISKAKRRELAGRVRELQGRVGELEALVTPAAGEPATSGPPAQEELEGLLDTVLPAVSALLEFLIGPEMKIDATERRVLVRTGAPAVAPYYARARAAAPVTPFLIALGSVFGPKLLDVLARQKREREAKGGPSLSPAPASEPALDVDGRDPFGGPRE